ncbi:MAG: Uma2 family endonuclease [Acidimicrobiaceae bacterium]|nr:Uma2 family endonuclease [Acidimicrobiaceae bacterium]MXZ99137.1 Uma2 family endonuclease [Acidimicrobiaceae bacterium]MYE77271.1 Uma2 family endonuclease [Acidimicrobiaceae bacterium]MYE96489.1 Uma2 family endonuclease [Acidimicrobiaceae bacterium]MYH43767.1 Uma2 family endonuclease [Acidimicrobiaceae bacterium]
MGCGISRVGVASRQRVGGALMSSIVAGPPEVEIDYPEGPRVPEGDLQTRRRVELLVALRQWHAGRSGAEGAWVCSDLNIYYREGDPRVVVAPDIAVAFGVDVAAVENQPSYRVWAAGAAPCFALEIASAETVRTDLEVKPAKYAELGVDEYWRFDPTGGELLDPPLQGDLRRSGRWTPIRVAPDGDGLRGRSEALGLDLCWRPPRLRLWDIAAGAWLLDHDDQIARAETAEARAGAEAAARQTAEAELAELRARLGDSP